MSGNFIINGALVPAPVGLTVTNYKDDPRLRLRIGQLGGGNDGARRRTRWIRSIVLHTTKGIPGGSDQRPQKILPGLGPNLGKEFDVAKFWATSAKSAGAALVVDFDGSVGQLHDLETEAAYHTGNAVNDISIGIEIYQGSNAELYQGQLDKTADLVNFLTATFGIQRQIPHNYNGPIGRLDESGGFNMVGVFGHRDITDRRGTGDPGDAIMAVLCARGYELFDFQRGEDVRIWAARQKMIGMSASEIDGIPGLKTTALLRALGYPDGIWMNGCPEHDHDTVAAAQVRRFMAESLIPLLGEEKAMAFLKRFSEG